jgi:hypothetical protein
MSGMLPAAVPANGELVDQLQTQMDEWSLWEDMCEESSSDIMTQEEILQIYETYKNTMAEFVELVPLDSTLTKIKGVKINAPIQSCNPRAVHAFKRFYKAISPAYKIKSAKSNGEENMSVVYGFIVFLIAGNTRTITFKDGSKYIEPSYGKIIGLDPRQKCVVYWPTRNDMYVVDCSKTTVTFRKRSRPQ